MSSPKTPRLDIGCQAEGGSTPPVQHDPGQEGVAFRKVYIKYLAFPRDVTASMKKQIQISEEQKKAAKRHA
jgi:hypothetical protein